MRFSDFLRWGGKKEPGQGDQGKQNGQKDGGSFWTRGLVREPSGPRLPSGAARIDWLDGTGARHRERVSLEVDDRGVVTARARTSLLNNAVVWVTPEQGRPVPAVVTYTEPLERGFAVSFSVGCPLQEQPGEGPVRLQWVDSNHKLISTPARIRNAPTEGLLEASASQSAPSRVLALIVGASFCCLGEVRGAREEDGRHLIELEAVTEAQQLDTAA